MEKPSPPPHCFQSTCKSAISGPLSCQICTVAVSGRHQLEPGEQAGSWYGSPGARPQPPPRLDGHGDGGGWDPPQRALVQMARWCGALLFSGKTTYILFLTVVQRNNQAENFDKLAATENLYRICDSYMFRICDIQYAQDKGYTI